VVQVERQLLSERKELCGGQLILRRSYFRCLLQEAQDNFAGLHVTKREHVRANGAEPIVNDMVGVLGSAWDNGHLSFHQAEAKKSSADEMIEVGAANRVGAFGNHGALPCTETME